MKFIKLNNLSLNSISKQETQQKIENTSDANKSEEKETQKSPNNPTFWQNTLFKKKQLSFKGDASATYNSLVSKYNERFPDIDEKDKKDLADTLQNILNKPAYKRGKYLDIFDVILQKENVPLKNKLLWMNLNLEDSHFRLDDGSEHPFFSTYEEKFDVETKLMEYYTEEQSKDLIDTKLTIEQSNQLLSLFENPNIEKADLKRTTASMLMWASQYPIKKIPLTILLDILSNDENKIPTFNRLISKSTFVYPLSASQLNNFLTRDSELINKTLNAFEIKNVNSKASFLVQDPSLFEDFIKIMDLHNIDDFYLETDGLSIEKSIAYAQSYVNGVTKLFDKELIEREKELKNTSVPSKLQKGLIQASIDEQTGKLSPIAKELVDFLYPQIQDEQTLTGKIKQLGTTIKQKTIAHSNIFVSIFPNDIIGLVNSLKDSKGSFSNSNLKDFYKLLRANRKENDYSNINVVAMATIMNSIKDKDGIVDRDKLNIAIKTIKRTHSYVDSATILEALNIFPDEKFGEIYNICTSIGENKDMIIGNLSSYAKFCFDESGNIKKENFDYLNKIVSTKEAFYTPDFFELLDNKPHLRNFIIDILPHIEPYQGITNLASEINNFDTEEKQLTAFEKSKILDYIKGNKSINDFTSFYNACFTNEKFDEETFNKALKLSSFEHNLFRYNSTLVGKLCIDIVKESLSVSDMKFKDKVHILDTLRTLRDLIKTQKLDGFEYMEKAISDLENSLSLDNVALPIEKEDKRNFIKNVLFSTNSKTDYTKFEQVIVDSIPYLETLTSGLKLSYSRDEFLKALSEICTTKEDIELLKKKTDISPMIKVDEGKQIITGYNGIIKLNDLDLSNPKEKEIYNHMYNFLYNNSISTPNKALNEELNYILKACPEFINCIGKKQHGTHNYTVDVHSLLVMAYSIQNPEYKENLNALDKTLLKMTTIFHDIMKQEGVVDKGHQHLSSLYTRGISKKIFTAPEIHDRLFELIDNHHWSEEYSLAEDKTKKAQELAYRFRRPNDFKISQIIALSDLKALNESFYERLKGCLDEENLKPIQDNLDKLYASGNALFTDRVIGNKKLENLTKTKNGKSYQVINLHKIGNNEDLGNYGFIRGKRKDDLFFLVHMVDSDSIYSSLNTVKLLTSPMNGGVLSESIITPKHARTYCDRKYGVILSQINTNIINESESNQGSGRTKDFSSIINLIFSGESDIERNNFRNSLLKILDIPAENISDKEYAKFYKETLASKNLIEEINLTKDYNIGKYTISGPKLYSAIKEFQNSLIDKEGYCHNEIVGYTPKINAVVAKANKFEELPNELLKFANENNLPIILI